VLRNKALLIHTFKLVLVSLTVSCVIVIFFCNFFPRISLFAFPCVYSLCNVCACHAVNKGNLLTYLLQEITEGRMMAKRPMDAQHMLSDLISSAKYAK